MDEDLKISLLPSQSVATISESSTLSLNVERKELTKLALTSDNDFSTCLSTWADVYGLSFAVHPDCKEWIISGSCESVCSFEDQLTKNVSPAHTIKSCDGEEAVEKGRSSDSLAPIIVNKMVWHYIREFCRAELFDIISKPIFYFKALDSHLFTFHFCSQLTLSSLLNIHEKLKILCQSYSLKLTQTQFIKPAIGPKEGAIPYFGVIVENSDTDNSKMIGPLLSVNRTLKNFKEMKMVISYQLSKDITKATNNLLHVYKLKNNISAKICSSDISQEPVDVIVAVVNDRLEMCDTITQSILSEAGEEVHKWCKAYIKKYGRLTPGKVLMPPAGNLKVYRIFYVVGFYWEVYTEEKKERYLQTVSQSYQACFSLAEKIGAASLAMPLIGIQTFIPVEKSAQAFLEALDLFSKENSYSLRTVFLIERDYNTLSTIIHVLDKELTSQVPLKQLVNYDKLRQPIEETITEVVADNFSDESSIFSDDRFGSSRGRRCCLL